MIGKSVSQKEAARMRAALEHVESGGDPAISLSIWTEFMFHCKAASSSFEDVTRYAQEARARIMREVRDVTYRAECLRQYDLVLNRISEFNVPEEAHSEYCARCGKELAPEDDKECYAGEIRCTECGSSDEPYE